MYLRTLGSSPVISPEETRYILEWAGCELLGPRLMGFIKVSLEWKKYPEEKGSCKATGHRTFRIRCNPHLGRRTQRKTLFHEMIHVKQYVRGELMDFDDKLTRWKKILVDEERVSYRKLPWEREAYRLETVLYRRYMDHLRRSGLYF